ncbi:MAG: hypothetical protein WBD16_12515 [Pyrinomonadaceae bacterium]
MSKWWRHAVIALILVGSFVAMFARQPFAQEQAYHDFADKRALFGIPNFGDVASNIAFLFAGLAGLAVCFTRDLGRERSAWIVAFAGIALVSVGSGYYHLEPTDATLFWDRATITVGFMGVLVAVLGEYVSERFNAMLWPAVIVGLASVVYWRLFEDLRFYYWIQLGPMVALPFTLLFFRPVYSNRWLLLAGLGWYGVAKLTELGDKVVFAATQNFVSGHTLKHLFAGLGCYFMCLALKK